MTKVQLDSFGRSYEAPVLDWYTKKIVGHYPVLRTEGLAWMANNGCQPTAVAFWLTCRAMGITQTFTSYNNTKGNADTVRMMRTV